MAELYDRYGRMAYALSFRIVRDRSTAEDLVQEIFFRIWNRAHLLDENYEFLGPWVLAITRNLALDHLRSRESRLERQCKSLEGLKHPCFFSNAERYIFSSDYVHRLRDAFAHLTAQQQQVIELAYYEGLTQSEMAERLDKPLGTIKSRVRTALKVLRDCLTAERLSSF
ncbi:MAG: sigma-70 family RNA polymerase sigma factor [Bryobacteraceae bacterium]